MTQQESARVQVEEVVRRIVAGFSPDRIVVFGSHARGEQTPESDLDLLVVMPVTGARRKQAATIELALVGVEFGYEGFYRVLPGEHDMDGAFAARMVRR